jgi:hypothetical protein
LPLKRSLHQAAESVDISVTGEIHQFNSALLARLEAHRRA